MGYDQWVEIRIIPKGCRLGIKNAHLDYGKFYCENNKDTDIPPSVIERDTNIETGRPSTIYACGRDSSPSGTQGRFQLYDKDTGTVIGTYKWDCPWGSSKNKSSWEPEKLKDYATEISGGNLYRGALGYVTIECGHF